MLISLRPLQRVFLCLKERDKMSQKVAMDVHEVPKLQQWFLLSVQHLFAMFGATILVPFLTGLSPAVALSSSGLGTIVYLLFPKVQIPAYVGSSVAFLAAIIGAITV